MLREAAERFLCDRERTTWLARLAGATVVYREPSFKEARALRLEQGLVVERATVRPGIPPGLPRKSAEPAGLSTVIEFALMIVKLVAGVAPKSTAVTPVNPLPVMVTSEFPTAGPDDGLTEVTTGAVA